MGQEPFRLVRDALGFYSQVPIEAPPEAPVVDVVHERIVPVCAPRRMGRPSKKKLNAEFEVDI